MDRRSLLIAAGALTPAVLAPAVLARSATAQTPLPPARPSQIPTDDGYRAQPPASTSEPQTGSPPPPSPQPSYPASTQAETYSREELVNAVSDFLGVTAESAGAVIERVFREKGRPTGYIAGEEGAAAFTVGLRYGKGLLYMKNRPAMTVYWQGPSIGFDLRANASRVFTLCYALQYPEAIYQRFPGVEGSAYLVGGLGVNYQRAEDIVLAPIRAGVGLGAGVNVGYLSYSRKRHILPF